MAAQRKFTAFRLDEDLLAGLERIRDAEGITIGEQLRRAVRGWLKKKRNGAKKKTARRRVVARRKA